VDHNALNACTKENPQFELFLGKNPLHHVSNVRRCKWLAAAEFSQRIFGIEIMRFNKVVMLLVCASLVGQASFAAAQSEQKAAGSMTKAEPMSKAFVNGYNVPSTGVAIEGYCPVCYIAANKAAKGDPNFAAEYNGVTYWFVSDDVRKMFAADPEKYLPAYGGWCAFGVATGQRFPVDPTNFKVVNGKIMLFLKNEKVDGVKIWNQNEAENLQKANANWQKLKG